jgi:hypothetical protein
VSLNFATLTWPHVSVATLVPAKPIPVDIETTPNGGQPHHTGGRGHSPITGRRVPLHNPGADVHAPADHELRTETPKTRTVR